VAEDITSQKTLLLKSTDKMMILARNATGTHVQDFLVNGELLLPIRKAFVQCTQTPYVVFKMLDVFSLVY
jgi:hypothetical protein